jgi:hypothetical protein
MKAAIFTAAGSKPDRSFKLRMFPVHNSRLDISCLGLWLAEFVAPICTSSKETYRRFDRYSFLATKSWGRWSKAQPQSCRWEDASVFPGWAVSISAINDIFKRLEHGDVAARVVLDYSSPEQSETRVDWAKELVHA